MWPLPISTLSLNVDGTASRVKRFLRDQNVLDGGDPDEETDPRVMLVAPAVTMTRTALTFEQLGMQAIAKPTNFYAPNLWSGDDVFERLPDLIPSVDALQLSSRYWNEVLTSTYYFLRGWLPGFNFGWNPNIEV